MEKNKIKILWFSSYLFLEEDIKATGTWVIAMRDALLRTGLVELYHITHSEVNEITRQDYKEIKQWILPTVKVDNRGLPPQSIIDFVCNVENEINPDLIHIWGTEYYWGMLAVHNFLKKPVLLEIQGLVYAYAKVFYGGLTISELIKCIGIKEILLPKRLAFFRKKEFEKRGKHEKLIIRSINNISVQSEWVKAHIKCENPNAQICDTGILLREEFYQLKQWSASELGESPIIFTSSSGSNMYKGLHVLFRAISILKIRYPFIRLKIAGRIIFDTKVQDGYNYWLLNEIKRLGIEENVIWLGAISGKEIIKNLYESSVFVVPSYVETYCLALAEAMCIGIPSVISFAGAMPELAIHNESALFFPVGDYMSCSLQIEKILIDKELAIKFSNNSRKLALERNNVAIVLNRQIEIYNKILNC